MLTRCPTCSAEYNSDDTTLTREGDWVCCPHCTRWSEVQLEERRRDQWTILTRDGRILSFASFEQVRTAFVVGLVEPDDRLLDEHGPSKMLTEVAELSTVLRAHRNSRKDTLPYAARVDTPSVPALGQIRFPAYSEWPNATVLPDFEEAGPATIRDDDDEVATLRPQQQAERDWVPLDSLFDQSPQFPAVSAAPHAPSPVQPAPIVEPEAPAPSILRPPPRSTLGSGARVPESLSPPSEAPLTLEVDSSEPARQEPKPQSTLSRVGVVALAATAGAVLALTLPLSRGPRPAPPVATATAKTSDFLSAERALHDGDFNRALLALKDVGTEAGDERELILRARAIIERAEAEWLRIQSLQAAQSEVSEHVLGAFADQAAEARWAARDVVSMVGERSDVLALELNALRVYGDVDRGRVLADRLAAEEEQADVLYALGAFDLVTPHSDVARAVSRLRRAAPDIDGRARIHALLTFALLSANDVNAATLELEKLGRLARPHPALSELRALLEKRRGSDPKTSIQAAPGAQANTLDKPKPKHSGLLAQAFQFKEQHQLGRAEQLYRTILLAQPGNCEALAGLGDIALRRGELMLARQSFEQALVNNSAYLPALIALADIAWLNADKTTALGYYRSIVARFPKGSYPAYVAERANVN